MINLKLRKDSEGLEPNRLSELAQDCIRRNITKLFLTEATDSFSPGDNKTGLWKSIDFRLKENVWLPFVMWDNILGGQHRTTTEMIWLRLALAKCEPLNGIQKLSLRNSPEVDDIILETLMRSCPKELDIHNCPMLTNKTFEIINVLGSNLESLVIGSSVNVLPTSIFREVDSNKTPEISKWNSIWTDVSKKFSFLRIYAESSREKLPSVIRNQARGEGEIPPNYNTIRTPKLTKLVIWGHVVKQFQTEADSDVTIDYWELLLKPFLHNLISLDLSQCQDIEDFQFLGKATNSILSLTLHDVYLPVTINGWGVIKTLKQLRYLDVSQSVDLAAIYSSPDTLLAETVESLPHLEGLDISGTNLAGSKPAETLRLYTKPLQFLGLVCTHLNADQRSIPNVARITGVSTPEQIVTSIQHYIMRPEILKKAMRSLLNMTIRKGFCLSDQRYAEAESINGYVDLTVSKISKICVPEFPYSHQCLELMVDILRIYVEDKPIATLALSNIRWLMRPEDSLDFSQATCCMKASLRRRLVENVIETMEVYEKDSPPLFMSGALLLCFLGDSICLAQIRLAKLMLRVIGSLIAGKDDVQMRLCCFLLKPLLIELGMKELAEVVSNETIKRLYRSLDSWSYVEICQDSLPTLWTAVNLTTNNYPENCIEFVKSDGLRSLLGFTKKATHGHLAIALKRCGLAQALCTLSNVSEVKSLRKEFFKVPECISFLFYSICTIGDQNDDESDTIGVINFLSISCLVNLLDEPLWERINFISREVILETINCQLDILFVGDKREAFPEYNFSGTSHLLTLLDSDTKECRLFAAWTLSHLCHAKPEIYIPMINPHKDHLVSAISNPWNAESLRIIQHLEHTLEHLKYCVNQKNQTSA